MEERREETAQCASIRCNARNLTEWDAGRRVLIVPLADIQRITLRHGVFAPHPLLLTLFGLALAAMGSVPFVHFILVARDGGHFTAYEIPLVSLLVIGLVVVFTAFRRGFFLLVETDRGHSRLRFPAKTSGDEIKAFVADLSRQFNLRTEIHT